ncbi:ribosomal protein S9 (plastid) [Cryptomonas paramecium]|uniref:Ribosomal protein S9 n=1 Tax=Cryptomonas paramaecium TaxID=2898 RepID=D2ISB7_9CRYP|nr:ribosomal protein S9 [Cryptomonas paramecium]ACT46809.1 ribosomal protein S9 [Cryptomonas paramecium]BDA97986.1 ribosomal protein S9 [Cryptomonas paramecium]
MKTNLYLGTGRRKNSTARVIVSPGTGKFTINNIASALYLQFNPNYLQTINNPLRVLNLDNMYDVLVNARGGGLTGQAEAIQLALSKALGKIHSNHSNALKFEKYLTTDPRQKERKKYGLKKARKAPQFSKR